MMLEATTVEVAARAAAVSPGAATRPALDLAATLRATQLEVWAAAVNHGGAFAQVALGHLRGVEPQIDFSLSAAVAVVRDRLDSEDSLPTCEQIAQELSR